MPEEVFAAPSTTRHWRRALAIVLGLVIVAMVIGYFTISSQAFFKTVVLPKVGAALHGEVTVDGASIKPFSGVRLRQLRVRTTGPEPLLQAQELRVRYRLFDLLAGKVKLAEFTVVSPTLVVSTEADGTSNLDPLLQLASGESAAPAGEAEPLALELKKVTLQNGTLRYVRRAADGSVSTTEFRNLNVTLDELANGKAGQLALSADARLDFTPAAAAAAAANAAAPTPATASDAPSPSQVQAKLAGTLDFALDPMLWPATLGGQTTLEITRAEGVFSQMAGLRAALECDLTPTEVRQLGVRVERGGAPLAQLRLAGPFELAKREGRLTLEVRGVDRQVLNLLGMTRGWDFANTLVGASNVVDVSRGGKLVAARGRLAVDRFAIRQPSGATPAVDLGLEYQFSVNLTEQTALLQQLNLRATTTAAAGEGRDPTPASRPLLEGALDRPMNLAWGKPTQGLTQASFQLVLQELNLADWRVFLPTNAPTGKLSAELKLAAQRDGQVLRAELRAQARELAAAIGTHRVADLRAEFAMVGQLENFRRASLDRCQFRVAQGTNELASGSATANYDLNTGDMGAQATVEASVAALTRCYPVPDLRASAGTLKFSGLLDQKEQRRTITGSVVLSDFTGAYGEYQFQDYQTTLEYDVEMRGSNVTLRRLAVSPRQGFAAGGSLDLTGRYDLDRQSGQFSFKTVALNEHALRPFLAPWLAPRGLISVSLNLTGNAAIEGPERFSTQLDLDLANLRVTDPEHQLPDAPWNAKCRLEAVQEPAKFHLRRLRLELAPTARAQNIVEATGRFDFSATNPAPSELTIRSDALDLTTYYDLFVDRTSATTPPQAPPSPAPSPPQPEQEPEPLALPLNQLTCDLNVARLFLRELACSNLVVRARLDGGKLTLDPCALSLNGAPVESALRFDLSVPGYTYDLALKAERVPLAPMVDSFSPENRGRMSGELLAEAALHGAGVTGANLQRHLQGQLNFSLTNANLRVIEERAKLWFIPINLRLIATVLGVPEIMDSPVTAMHGRAQIGSGRVDLTQFQVLSDAFLARAAGVVQLAPHLTNSPLDIPVDLALRRSLADKAKLVPADTPPDAAYVTLPRFVKLTGTLGNPQTHVDKLPLLSLTARGVGGLVGGQAEKVLGTATGLVEGIGGLLTGRPATTNAPADATAPASGAKPTNAPPRPNPLDALRNLFQKPE
jgi:uncharacterized protein involved in outer membrane biogenesis